MLEKARVKIVARAIYTHLAIYVFFTLSSSAAKSEVVTIVVFLSKLDHRLLSGVIRVGIPQELDVVAFWSWNLDVVIF